MAEEELETGASPELKEEIPTPSDEKRIGKLSRRSLLWSLAYFAGIAGVLRYIDSAADVDDLKAPLRKVLGFNENVWERLFSPSRKSRLYPKNRVTPDRLNETIGMDEDLDPDTWRLVIEGVRGQPEPIKLKMADIHAMPSMEMTTEFFCIEGWSVIQTWKGVAMREFMKRYPPLTISGAAPDLLTAANDLVPYVLMTTPDGGYYVGLDMGSVIHEQTMLCYEMNGEPLTSDHGAPLRLIIPVKYGVKNIKRLGKIHYMAERPKDYWAEQGYDWFAGL